MFTVDKDEKNCREGRRSGGGLSWDFEIDGGTRSSFLDSFKRS
jgi:hypothetical protein